jgi:putative ABC transport system permease protein
MPADRDVRLTRLTGRDLLREAIAGVCQRPARTTLTMLGPVIAVGAFVVILGLTSTTAGQISSAFSALAATQVIVNDVGAPATSKTINDFPPDSDQILSRLNGVVHAGQSWLVGTGQMSVTTTDDPRVEVSQVPVAATSPGYLAALDPTIGSGRIYDRFAEQHALRVAVLGESAAVQLGVSTVATQPAIFIDGVPFTVVGIISSAARQPGDLLSIFIPVQTAGQLFGQPAVANPPKMLVETRLGAASLIAHQAPTALRPDDPKLLQAVPPPDSHALQNHVSSSLNSLFLVLAAITLFVGAIGIANTTLVAVMERTQEIGLRRSIGARPRHVALQFLAETTAIGTLGGLIGTALGVLTVVIVALAHSWTALLSPVATLPAPLIGTITGLLAGTYPALRAARIEPVAALRR